MDDARIRALIKIPNVSAQNFRRLTIFLSSSQNHLPADTAGPVECAELLGAERESDKRYRVALLVTIAYPYAGGQHALRRAPGSVVDALFRCLDIFPLKRVLEKNPYYD